MKRLLIGVVLMSYAVIPSHGFASSCGPSEIHILSRAALVDDSGAPFFLPDGTMIGTPEFSDTQTCDLPATRIVGDVLPGANLLTITETGHRPKFGSVEVHGSRFGLTFPAEPIDGQTWPSDLVELGYFDTVLPADKITVELCTEGNTPATTWCSTKNFSA